MPDLMTGLYEYPDTPSHPGFQINFSVNFEAGSGGGADSQAFRFIGTEGVLNLSVGNSLSISKRPRELDPGTTAATFSKKIQEQILAEHRAKYPPRLETADSLRRDAVETFPLPRGYSEQVAHHQTFQNAIRTRTPVVEDPVFGLRAAGPALMSNVSYFERRMGLLGSCQYAHALRGVGLVAGGIAATAGLEQEPGAPLGFVDPDLDQARGGDVAVLVADVVRLAQARRERLVVLAQLGEHVLRLDVVGVVVDTRCSPGDVADRAERGAADLADALGDRVGHREELVACSSSSRW